MSIHKRRSILTAIRVQLKTSSLFRGVWIQRIPRRTIAFPQVTLYAETESTETVTIHQQPRCQERTLNVTVTGWVRGTPDDEKSDADLDATALEIETLMVGTFGAEDCNLLATDFIIDDDEPELHSVALTYQISYSTTEQNPV